MFTFSRPVLFVGATLLGVALILGLGRQFLREQMEAAQFDWWNLPRVYSDHQRSLKGVETAQRIRDELKEMSRIRNALLAQVVAQEITVPEGFDLLKRMHEELPGMQRTLRGAYPTRTTEDALVTHYREMLLDHDHLAAEDRYWVLNELDALFDTGDILVASMR